MEAAGVLLPDALQGSVGAGRDGEQAAVLDVGDQHVPVGELHRVVGVAELVRAGAGHPGGAVAPEDPVLGDADQRHHLVCLLGSEDVVACGGEEGGPPGMDVG